MALAPRTLDVKLPDRTRARHEEAAQLGRAAKPHDIRMSIPFVDYTNPAKFPPYVFREYPKMPLLDNNRPIVIDDSGGVLVFYDAADEVEFKDMNPDLAEEIERNAPAKQIHERFADMEEEIEKLRRKLAEAGIEPEARPARGGLAGVVRASEDGESLKAKVQEAADRAAKPNPLKKGAHTQ